MFTCTGGRSGLSQSQHAARPQSNNLLMELATEKIELVKGKKKKKCIVEPSCWGTHNSPGSILIPLSGKFQARQEVRSCHVDEY